MGKGEVVITVGDIALESTDAIVNATDAWLSRGGALTAAIHQVAGPRLFAACKAIIKARPAGKLEKGEAVVTPGFLLRARHVIHCAGPIYRDDPGSAPDQLSACIRNALRLCRELKLRSIAFPAIGTGAYRYPLKDAALVSLSAVQSDLLAHPVPILVKVVLFTPKVFHVFAHVAERRL